MILSDFMTDGSWTCPHCGVIWPSDEPRVAGHEGYCCEYQRTGIHPIAKEDRC